MKPCAFKVEEEAEEEEEEEKEEEEEIEEETEEEEGVGSACTAPPGVLLVQRAHLLVVAQVEFESKGLKPGNLIQGSRVETRRF